MVIGRRGAHCPRCPIVASSNYGVNPRLSEKVEDEGDHGTNAGECREQAAQDRRQNPTESRALKNPRFGMTGLVKSSRNLRILDGADNLIGCADNKLERQRGHFFVVENRHHPALFA